MLQSGIPSNLNTLKDRMNYIAGSNLFFDDYPIWDENHRQELNYKILNHYLFREIGLETPELWKWRLHEKMDYIMPEYNLKAKAFTTDFPLLQNINTVREYVINQTGSGNRDVTLAGTTTNSNTGKIINTGTQGTTESGTTGRNDNENTKHSDYPQSNISTGDYLSEEQNHTFGSNGNTSGKSDTTTSAQSDTTDNGTTNTNNDTVESNTNKQDTTYKESLTGLQGYPVDFLLKYLNFVQDLDKQIISDLEDLFFILM